MTTSMRERYPEVMAFADLCNVTADGARAIWFAFLAFMTFLALAVFGTSPRDLFLATPLGLPPPISIEIDLVGFYVVAPTLLLALHLYMLLKLSLLVRVHGNLEVQISEDARPADRAQIRKHLNTTIFLRTLSDWKAGDHTQRPSHWLMTGLLIGSLALAPVATLLFTWIKFLPYQSEAVTMIHRVILFFDVLSIVVTLRAQMNREGGRWVRWVSYGAAALFIALAWNLLTFPKECWDEDERFCWDDNWLLKQVGISRTIGPQSLHSAGIITTSLSWPPTTLQLADEDFVDDVKVPDLSKLRSTHNLRNRSLVGADLTNTDLKKIALAGADIRVASLSRAELTDANLSDAQMQETMLDKAEMEGADLTDARMQGANLAEAKMQDVKLRNAGMQGANLYSAEMQGADLTDAKMQGARLSEAQLQGANLRYARMQGADLVEVKMQGADLSHGKLQGAVLNRAQMQGADLGYARTQGAEFIETQMQGVNLQETIMRGADLTLARMQGASFLKTDIQGALVGGTFVWRTLPIGLVGDAEVITPMLEPLKKSALLVERWLASIPPGDSRNRAEKQFIGLMHKGKTALDYVVQEYWEKKSLPTDEASKKAGFKRHWTARSDAILAYACNETEGIEPAIEGMLWGVLGQSWRQMKYKEDPEYIEYLKSTRSAIEHCRPGQPNPPPKGD